MRRATLLFNPSSGRRLRRRLADIEAVRRVLRDAGVEAAAIPTCGPGAATEQAREAIAAGADTIFACGGDGTVHEILQGIAGTSTALAVIPLGTGNVLAHDLGIPNEPTRAAQFALACQPRRVPAGRVHFLDIHGHPQSRFFLSVAGCGADALVIYRMTTAFKARFGLLSFFLLGGWMLATLRFNRFAAVVESSHGRRECESPLVMALRISSLGPFIPRVAPGASLAAPHLSALLFTSTNRLQMSLYLLGVGLRRNWSVRDVEVLPTARLTCRPLDGQRIYVEADGELLGRAPAEFEVVPDALTLLLPRNYRP